MDEPGKENTIILGNGTNTENAIETKDLTKRYNGFPAVDKLNLQVKRGEVFGLLGPNGAGKTTTISMLCTILKPSSGAAKVHGFDILKQPTQVRKSIGIVFQDPSIDDRLTGFENLAMHANLYAVPRQEQKIRINNVLKLVELEERAGEILRNYSGGMRRRLEIARGLIHYPEVLFLDEPTIGLDPQTRGRIWEYIQELRKKYEITIVLTTHYMEEADRLSDRIAIMDYGTIVAQDTPFNLKKTLGGDVLTVRTKEIDRLSALIMKKIPGQKILSINDEIQLAASDGKKFLPRILELATKNNVYIDSVSIREPNLEDVFLHYTGRAIREESSEKFRGLMAIKRRGIK